MNDHSRTWPVVITCEPGVEPLWLSIAEDAVHSVLRVAGVANLMPIRVLGTWRAPDYREGNRLKPHHSVEWLVEQARLPDRPGYLNTTPILTAFCEEPWQEGDNRHHDVFIVRQGLSIGDSGWVFGSATQNYGCVISTAEFLKPIWEEDPIECFRTIVMHEFGHTLGLVSVQRREHVQWLLGQHCTLRCIMRQRMHVRGWDEITRDRLSARSPFCTLCEQHLHERFGTGRNESFRPRGVRYRL